MKTEAAILALILLVSSVALARDKAQVAINNNAEAVQNVAIQVLGEAGYSVSSQGPGSIVFAKELTGASKFATRVFLTSSECVNIPPRLYLTLNLARTEYGTLATISAMVEHTAWVEHMAQPYMWSVRHTYHTCDTVRDPPFVFMHTQRMLTNVLKDIRSKNGPRESVTTTVSAGR